MNTPEYITIDLSKTGKHAGKYKAIVSPEDEILAELNWSVTIASETRQYAHRVEKQENKQRNFKLHRVVMSRMLVRDLLPTEEVDHADGDGLNNTRPNLRLVTKAQNQQNARRRKDSKSGFKGVYWHERDKKWEASVQVNGKRKWLGRFETAEKANEACTIERQKAHGNFANHGN